MIQPVFVVTSQAERLLWGSGGRKHSWGSDRLHWWSFGGAQSGSWGSQSARRAAADVFPNVGQGPWTQSPHHLIHTGRVFKTLIEYVKKSSYGLISSVCFDSQPAEGETVESVLDCGLVRGHAYGITAVRKLRCGETMASSGGMPRLLMVRMRNPWGSTDWTGAWSQRWEFTRIQTTYILHRGAPKSTQAHSSS